MAFITRDITPRVHGVPPEEVHRMEAASEAPPVGEYRP
jgi:hypothetical protein